MTFCRTFEACIFGCTHWSSSNVFVHTNSLDLQVVDDNEQIKFQTSQLSPPHLQVYGDPLVHPQQEDYWGNVNPIG